nr:hypothetical protein [uncultured Duganella sp.]
MSKEIIIALVSSLGALLVSLVAVFGQQRIARTHREMDSAKVVASYREPLMQAASDLQSRLYNILKGAFFETFYQRGDERERLYVVTNTVYLFAQYFAWVEAMREEIQFIDQGSSDRTRALSHHLGAIYSVIQTDKYGKTLRMFAGEQRAIGERMLVVADGRRCIGYGEFLKNSSFNEDMLFHHLTIDVTRLAEGAAEARQRIVQLQRSLIDLLNLLDPKCIRFPAAERQKIST